MKAVAGIQEFIEREHLFIGLAKAESLLADLESTDVRAKMGDPAALLEELRNLGDCFRRQNLDVEKARRRARYLAGKGEVQRTDQDAVHRSAECREAFVRAVEYAQEGVKGLHCLHLLAGLLAQPGVRVAQAIAFGGGDFEKLREAALKEMVEYVPSAVAKNPGASASMLSRYGTDLTQMVQDGIIEPLVGRKKELLQLIRILSRKTKNNPILLGEPGVGKTALVRALA